MTTEKLYSDCSSISIFLFHKILETNNYELLLTDYKYRKEFTEEELKETWGKIYEEYCKISDDNKALMYYSTYSELLYLETRFAIASAVLKSLIDCVDIPKVRDIYIDTLATWQYKINKNKPLHSEIEKVFKNLEKSKNKIRLKKDELENYKPDENSESMTLTQQAVKLAQGLGKDKIDTKTTMVDEWVYLIKELKEINDAKKKANNKHK